MATQGQRKRKLKQRKNHSERNQQTMDNMEVVVNINNYKGVNGMKKKVLKMVNKVKSYAKKIKRWFQTEEVKTAATAIGIVATFSASSFVVGYSFGQLNVVKRTRPVIAELYTHMTNNSKVIRTYIRMMDAFWSENSEARKAFEAFRKNWDADDMMLVVTS